jgi:hypothetical protein
MRHVLSHPLHWDRPTDGHDKAGIQFQPAIVPSNEQLDLQHYEITASLVKRKNGIKVNKMKTWSLGQS